MSIYFKLFMLLTSIVLLQGCMSALIVGSAAVATKTATDPRSIGKQTDDSTLKLRISSMLHKDTTLSNKTKLSVSTYNGTVLLTGQAPTEQLRQHAVQIAKKINGVTALHDQIRILKPIKADLIVKDSWITTKIRSQILTNQQIAFNRVKIVTENSEVFLFGLVTRKEAEIATTIASHTKDVKKVIKLFNYLND